MRRLGVLLLFCAACVESGEVRCADGRLCAPGTTCDDENMRCLSAEQVAACSGKAEGAECSFGGAPGACRRGACEPLVCGDGVRSFGEACDGEDLGGKTCVDAGFYEPDGLACSEFCTFDTAACAGYCGDDIVNGDELCDGAPPQVSQCIAYGFDAGRASCSELACALSFATCGRIGWIPEASTLSMITALDGTSENDLWVIGEDLVNNQRAAAHFDGATWSAQTLAVATAVIAVAVAAPGDVWIVADKGGTSSSTLLRRVNGTFAPVNPLPSTEFRDVWARGANEVYLATRDAGVQLWNGSSWQRVGSGATSVDRVRGSAANELWAVKSDGTLEHWNGNVWMPVAVDVKVNDLDVQAPDNVWVVGTSTFDQGKGAAGFWNGATWTVTVDAHTTATVWPSVAAIAKNDVWVATSIGDGYHFDGAQWGNAAQVVVDASANGFVAMRRFGTDIIAASFDGYVYRYRGAMYSRYNINATNGVIATWSNAPNDTIAIDARASGLHFNGVSWTKRTIDTDAAPHTNKAIWGAASNAVWVVGSQGRIFFWNGGSWSKVHEQTATPMADVVGTSATNVWFVGNAIVHYDGQNYEQVALSPAPPPLRVAAASGANDIWAAGSMLGDTGTDIYRFNGATWSTSRVNRRIKDLAVLTPDLAFAVADENLVMRWNGASWSEHVLPTSVSDPLRAIVALAADDVFAASEQQLFHFDGTQWTPVRSPTDEATFNRTLGNLWAAPDRIDISYSGSNGPVINPAIWPVRRLVRTKRWH